jgi:transcriptional regulator with XRE-family HTH domain
MNENVYNGEILRSRREEMGLALEEVFQMIHVPVAHLRDLEAGNLHRLPPACYTVGFLRSYCRFLGVDAHAMIEAYNKAILPASMVSGGFVGRLFGKLSSAPSIGASSRVSSAARGALAGGRGANLMAWLAACALVALCWLTYSVVLQPSSDLEQNKVQAEEIIPPRPEVDFLD